MTRIIFFFIAVFSFQLVTAQSRKAEKLKIDYLQSSPLYVNNKPLPILKWENRDTIHYKITGDFTYMSQKSWKKFLGHLESSTGLIISETSSDDKAVIDIFFGELLDYAAHFNVSLPPEAGSSNFDHWTSRKYNSQKQLAETSMCIVPSQTRDTQRGSFNLKRQFLKCLGFLGEIEDESSIFYKYNTIGNTGLSKADRRIIRIHYLPEIKAGMSYEELNRTLETTIDLEEIARQKI